MHEQLDRLPLIDQLRTKHDRIFVIMAPPRSVSTTVARLFWQQPSVRYYSHEPYETTYYRHDPITVAHDHLLNPLDLTAYHQKTVTAGNDLVIKDMSFQAAPHFSTLLNSATEPLLFLIRDPRLTIYSRIQRKLQVGQSLDFPHQETGWELLHQQMLQCRKVGKQFILMETTALRDHPATAAHSLFAALGLPFSLDMLTWPQANDVPIDNLAGGHSHLYQRVLQSTSVEPPDQIMPELSDFPEEFGLREHVGKMYALYQSLLTYPELLPTS